jgi:Lrp/AsnC family transcriptional regulator, leucine-responsive regulatory protein
MTDDRDERILTLLRREGRMPFAHLADAADLSAPAAAERVRKLERAGVIAGYQAVIDPAAVGLGFCAFVEIAQQPRSSGTALTEALGALREIEELHAVAGPYAYLAKVRVADPPALDALLDRLMLLPGVERTQTVVVLRTVHQRPPALPFESDEDALQGVKRPF